MFIRVKRVFERIYILFISTRNYRCTYNNNNFQKGRAVVKRGLAILFATRNLAQFPFHTFVTVPRFLTRRLELSQPSVLNFSATSKTDGQRFFASMVPVRALFVIISSYPPAAPPLPPLPFPSFFEVNKKFSSLSRFAIKERVITLSFFF